MRKFKKVLATGLAVLTIAGSISSLGIVANASDNGDPSYVNAHYQFISNEEKAQFFGFDEADLIETVVDGVTYKYVLYNNRACIKDVYTDDADKSIVVPNKLDGHTVYRIGSFAFCQTKAKAVTISGTIGVEPYAFYRSRISTVRFYGSVTLSNKYLSRMDDTDNCKRIAYTTHAAKSYYDPVSELFFDDGYQANSWEQPVTSTAGLGLFAESEVEKVVWADTMTTIPAGCFFECSILTQISNTDNVLTVGEAAFSRCRRFKSISLPSVTRIKAGAFAGSALKNLITGNQEKLVVSFHGLYSIPIDDMPAKFHFENVGRVTFERGALGGAWSDAVTGWRTNDALIYANPDKNNFYFNKLASDATISYYDCMATKANSMSKVKAAYPDGVTSEEMLNTDTDRGNVTIYTNDSSVWKYGAYTNSVLNHKDYIVITPYLTLSHNISAANNNNKFEAKQDINIDCVLDGLPSDDDETKVYGDPDEFDNNTIQIYVKGGAVNYLTSKKKYMCYDTVVKYRPSGTTEWVEFPGYFPSAGKYDLIIGFTDTIVERTTYKNGIYVPAASGDKKYVTIKNIEVFDKFKNTSTTNVSYMSAGSKVTIKGSSEGGNGDVAFAFQYQPPGSNKWYTIDTAYDGSVQKTIKFSKVGTYKVKVTAKDSKCNRVEKIMPVDVIDLKNTSTVSADTMLAASRITIKGSATGGDGNKNEFAFQYQPPGSNKWYTIGTAYDGSSEKSIKFSKTGVYKVKVIVRDLAEHKVTKTMNVNVSDPDAKKDICIKFSTDEKLSDAKLKLYRKSDNVFVTSISMNAQGYFCSKVPVCDYYAKAVNAPGGYSVVLPESYDITAKDIISGEMIQIGHSIGDPVSYLNKPIAVVNGSDEPIAGVVFGLYDSDDNLVYTATTDANGELSLSLTNSMISSGYYLKTKSMPNGYSAVPNGNKIDITSVEAIKIVVA